MKHYSVTWKVRLDVWFDPEEWGIVGGRFPVCLAERLNDNLEFYVNSGYDRKTIYDNMMRIITENKDMFADGATIHVARDLLFTVLGDAKIT